MVISPQREVRDFSEIVSSIPDHTHHQDMQMQSKLESIKPSPHYTNLFRTCTSLNSQEVTTTKTQAMEGEEAHTKRGMDRDPLISPSRTIGWTISKAEKGKRSGEKETESRERSLNISL